MSASTRLDLALLGCGAIARYHLDGIRERAPRVRLAAAIDRDRAAGLAVKGPSSHQLAAMLLWSSDRCLYVASLGIDDDLPGERETVEPLMAIWMGAVYGAEPVAKRATRGRGTRKR